MEKKIACVYMTYNKSDIAESLLSNICDLYKKKGIDIIFYDSSDNDEIKKLVEQYNLNGYTDIYYVDMKFTDYPDEKYIYMLKNYGFPKHYDYVYNSKDRCFFRGKALDEIIESVQEGHDVVFALCESDRWRVRMPDVKDVYTDPVEFFSHYGQLTTNWECLIRKTETMIEPVNWDECIQKYNMANDKSFNQTISLFSRLAELDNCSIKVVRADFDNKIYVSNTASGWINDIFDIWLEQWITAIWSLPAIYDQYKLQIIRDEIQSPYLFGCTDRIILYKQCGILTREVFEKYRSTWKSVIDFPEEFVNLILEDKIKELYLKIAEMFINAFKEHDYDKAYLIFHSNRWFGDLYEKDYYNDLMSCFTYYKAEINEYGDSELFNGINTTDELVDRYKILKNHINKTPDKKIAWCIPTYNRPIEVNTVLEKMLPILAKYSIDLYVYDSSANDETENIAKTYKSYNNFSYIKLPSDTKVVEKEKMIFTGYKQKVNYDYVWLVKDHVICDDELIKNIIKAANDDPDAIFLRLLETLHTINLTKDHYSDPVSLYHDWGWLITSWDSLILSRKRILDNIDWDEIITKYAVNGDISFILVILLFDTLAEKQHCSVPVISAQKNFFNIPQNKNVKGTFNIWGFEWYHTNNNLPEIYNDEKEFVIKSATSLPWILGNNIRLMELQQSGALTDQDLECVKDIWDKISDVPWQEVCEIQKGDRDYFEQKYVEFFWDLIKKLDINMVQYYYSYYTLTRKNIISKDLLYTVYTIEIWENEISENNIYIFNGGNNKEFVFMKIDLIIQFLQVLENNENVEMPIIKECLKNQLISITMIAYLMCKTGKNNETMIKKLSEFLSEN